MAAGNYMRMWGVEPVMLCNQHLLGEHVEMHMFAGCLRKGMSLKGYYRNKLVCARSIKKRHDELAAEMIARGMKHKSPLEELVLPGDYEYGEIDIEVNIRELSRRCPDCRKQLDSTL
ncbi:MAG: hypothetical protein JW770_01575 [Actinobacteria bacterium]|nr:hypothetical protein [Actinomycetota bacterium]